MKTSRTQPTVSVLHLNQHEIKRRYSVLRGGNQSQIKAVHNVSALTLRKVPLLKGFLVLEGAATLRVLRSSISGVKVTA